MSRGAIELVVLDLDNTLYDWTAYYIPSFLAMVRKLTEMTDIDAESLKRAFKKVHEKHQTTEYSFSIEELDILNALEPNLSSVERLSKYDPAIQAFRSRRSQLLRLYPGVAQTLGELRRRGKTIAALTDTTTFYSSSRLRQLAIEHYFDILSAPKDHGVPEGIHPTAVRSQPTEAYLPNIPQIIEETGSRRKPDPQLLMRVIRTAQATPDTTVVLGDSLLRDVKMAKDSGAWDVLAVYGSNVEPGLYSELLKITYWTAEEVAAITKLNRESLTPTFAIHAFPELLNVIEQIEAMSAKTRLSRNTTPV